ncbi:tyrosine-protein phosphatase [Humibacter ginsengisoli]
MRDLDWDGCRNVRDLGGLPTPLSRTGTTIAGRIARGPRRELLTDAGWVAAQSWGLRSVVDLRNEGEIGRRETDPMAEPLETLSIVHAPTEDQGHPEFQAVCMPILDSPEYWRHNLRILPGHVRGALVAVASARPGILMHCSAGRDRTGMMSALLLANAGVSADDILADYAASVRAMAGTASHAVPTNDRQASWTPAQVDAWLTEVEPFVRAFVADIDEAFGLLTVDEPTCVALCGLLTDQT